MANFLSEMGAVRCRNASGKYVPCPSGLRGCGITGCGGIMGGKTIPFDLPMIGGEVNLDLTDALTGALSGKAILGVTNAVVGKMAPAYQKHLKMGAGALAIGGLFVESLRENSMFLGFAIPTITEAAEPLTDFVATQIVKLIEKVSGQSYAPEVTATAAGVRGIGQRRINRIGNSQGISEVRASFRTPAELIRSGSMLSGARIKSKM